MATLNFNVPADWRTPHYKMTKLILIFDEFINSNADVAEYQFAEGEYSSAASCVSSLKGSLKKW